MTQDSWPGLATDDSPHLGGARVSDNCRPLQSGVLSGRGGTRELWFDNATAREAAEAASAAADITTLPDILAVACLKTPIGDYLLYLNDLGELHAGRRPT